MKSITLANTFSCDQSWKNMRTQHNGRFCEQCETTIVDLTKSTDHDLYNYFKKIQNPICARLTKSQLNTPLYPTGSLPQAINLKVMILGAMLLTSSLTWSSVPTYETEKISLVQSIIDDTLIETKHVTEDCKFYFKVKDQSTGEDLYAVRVVFRDRNNDVIAGTITDLDGTAEVSLSIEQWEKVYFVEFKLFDFTTVRRDVKSIKDDAIIAIEMTPVEEQEIFIGIMIKDDIQSRPIDNNIKQPVEPIELDQDLHRQIRN